MKNGRPGYHDSWDEFAPRDNAWSLVPFLGVEVRVIRDPRDGHEILTSLVRLRAPWRDAPFRRTSPFRRNNCSQLDSSGSPA